MQDFKHLSYKNLNWYHFDKPLTENDRQFLLKNFPFSQEDLDYCKAKKSPRPRINPTSKYLYFIFHIPYKSKNSSRFHVAELNVFITKTSLVTVESSGNLTALNEFLDKTKTAKLKESRFQPGIANLFSRLMLNILSALEEHIDKQGEDIDRLHREVFAKRLAKLFVETISIIRYNQVVAHSALERQIRFYDQYRGDKNPLLPFNHGSKTNWNKILETLQAITYELESDMDHLEGLLKTFESLVTFRTNEIIKLLTVFSVILMPLTLISGIWGMNFRYLPLALTPEGFFIVLIVMAIIATSMAALFRWKRWF